VWDKCRSAPVTFSLDSKRYVGGLPYRDAVQAICNRLQRCDLNGLVAGTPANARLTTIRPHGQGKHRDALYSIGLALSRDLAHETTVKTRLSGLERGDGGLE
jgi:hypothetical protein